MNRAPKNEEPLSALSDSRRPKGSYLENSPARLTEFYPISDKGSEASLQNRSSPSTYKSQKVVSLAPELTLDDLREKLKADVDNTVRKTINFENGEKLRASMIDSYKNDSYENKDLVYSISSLGGSATKHRDTIDQVYDIEASFSGKVKDNTFSLLDKDPMRDYSFEHKSPKNPSNSQSTASNHMKSFSKVASPNLNYNSGYHTGSTKMSNFAASDLTSAKLSDKYNSNLYFLKDQKKDSFKSSTPTKSKLEDSSGLMGSRFSASKSGKELEMEVKEQLDVFSKKLAEIQEEFGQSKFSQDPYKISINTMKTISKEDGLDTLSSKRHTPMRFNQGFGQDAFQTDRRPAEGTEQFKPGFSMYGTSLGRDYTEGLKEAKLRYFDMFMPDEMKIMNNPFKILKHKYDQKFQRTIKENIEEFSLLQTEIDQTLFLKSNP